jgi:hypothetical protein
VSVELLLRLLFFLDLRLSWKNAVYHLSIFDGIDDVSDTCDVGDVFTRPALHGQRRDITLVMNVISF